MNELQIVNLEQTDISTWNFDQIKEELSRVLAVYKTTVYTDETIKSAKQDKSTLAKAKKLIEDQRKAYKAKCLAPYEALEPQIKELVTLIEEQRILVDEVVKDYTERQKQKKEEEIRKYYDKKATVLGVYADALYSKILDPKWMNSSTSKAKYEEEIQIAIHNAMNDITAIQNMNSPFVETLLEKYISTLSLEDAKAQHEELVAATSKAGLNQNENMPVPVNTSELKLKTDAGDGILLKIYANEIQFKQVCDFMKAIGINYDIQ